MNKESLNDLEGALIDDVIRVIKFYFSEIFDEMVFVNIAPREDSYQAVIKVVKKKPRRKVMRMKLSLHPAMAAALIEGKLSIALTLVNTLRNHQ